MILNQHDILQQNHQEKEKGGMGAWRGGGLPKCSSANISESRIFSLLARQDGLNNPSVEICKTRTKLVQIYISPTKINITQSSSYLENTYFAISIFRRNRKKQLFAGVL